MGRDLTTFRRETSEFSSDRWLYAWGRGDAASGASALLGLLAIRSVGCDTNSRVVYLSDFGVVRRVFVCRLSSGSCEAYDGVDVDAFFFA